MRRRFRRFHAPTNNSNVVHIKVGIHTPGTGGQFVWFVWFAERGSAVGSSPPSDVPLESPAVSDYLTLFID